MALSAELLQAVLRADEEHPAARALYASVGFRERRRLVTFTARS